MSSSTVMAIRCCAVVALLLAWSVTVVAVRGVGASSSVNWDVVDQVLQEGIANKVFPGCVAAGEDSPSLLPPNSTLLLVI